MRGPCSLRTLVLRAESRVMAPRFTVICMILPLVSRRKHSATQARADRVPGYLPMPLTLKEPCYNVKQLFGIS